MAKKKTVKKTVGGVNYYRVEEYPEIKCPHCERITFSKYVRVYAIGSKDSNNYICGFCVQDLKYKESQKDFQQQEKNVITECMTLPVGSALYLGNKGKHNCTEKNIKYRNVYLIVRKSRKKTKVRASICENCGKVFISTKTYDESPPSFKNYEIIEIFWDGTHFNWTEESKKERKKLPGEVAPSLQRAAYKPYQGGCFSGK